MDQQSAAQRSIETGLWLEKRTTKKERCDRVNTCLREDARAIDGTATPTQETPTLSDSRTSKGC